MLIRLRFSHGYDACKIAVQIDDQFIPRLIGRQDDLVDQVSQGVPRLLLLLVIAKGGQKPLDLAADSAPPFSDEASPII